ncbi:NUMOD4 motif-containing HNH endonuclease [Actinomycetospora endophytica]|uniref:NUMOD4 motif-containing HNH endonuclease n=1 Tax=Actinomycetospora endophytica TaxID=2291215 RepID=A0ABS8P5F2_9PSEU|nr:NUMOD4 domain-containing protein [Actinomycetospora endophytica]MCD2193485.1 NUMOD4 motif-containing HNH endonuclease [Actinomycetospora endophytica]
MNGIKNTIENPAGLPAGPEENWKPIPGFPGYLASDLGQLRGRKGGILAQQIDEHGYHRITLRDARGRSRTRFVHNVILEAFVSLRPAKLDGCHNDGDQDNNALTNLRWDTRSANTYDKVRHGTHNYGSRNRCDWGHEYTEFNTQMAKVSGGSGRRYRRCRACNAAGATVWYAGKHGEQLDFQQVADGKFETFRAEHEARLREDAQQLAEGQKRQAVAA